MSIYNSKIALTVQLTESKTN